MKNKRIKNAARLFGKAAGTVFLVGTLTLFFSAVGFIIYAKHAPGLSVDEFYTVARAQDKTSRLYYVSYSEEDGRADVIKEMETLYAEQNRDWVKYGELPENLINAFVAIEDHSFFTHKGVNLKRTAGAILGYLRGNGSYGGSTITQQLIKNVSGDDGYSVGRKVREIIKAYKLDAALSKEEILELYLNTIYLAEKSYGVGTAARTYFGKDVSELSLTECAALACIPQSPTKWNPAAFPENNEQRRKTVLMRMAELNMISQSEAERAINTPLVLSLKNDGIKGGDKIYSWYTESVIEECIRLLTEKGIAANRQTATKMIYTGGLQIVTACNPEMQNAVEAYFRDSRNFFTKDKGVPKKNKSKGESSLAESGTEEENASGAEDNGSGADGGKLYPECSMVIMDKKGNILALAGGVGEKKTNRGINYATGTLRSPGSVIKPLAVYAPAIDCGQITYGSVIDDTPVKFVPTASGGSRGWPQNYPVGYRGLTTVRDAVARSVNTVAVKVLERYGVERSFELLYDGMKMRHLVNKETRGEREFTDRAVCPLALGQLTDGVSVSELTAGYTAFLGAGVFNESRTVLKIMDSEGKVIVNNAPRGKELFSPETATVMTKLLQGVTGSGTASAMKMKETVECAGKTGTTNNDYDRWYVGFTPDLIAGVWFGYPEPHSLEKFPTSPSPALKTWDNVMKILNTEKYLGREPARRFTDAKGVVTATYCRDSGKLMTAACTCDPRGSRAETGYFTADTVPTEYCDCHVLVDCDAIHGGVASPFCPAGNRVRVGLLKVTREFPHDVIIADAQYTYRYLSEDTPPCLYSNEPFYRNLLPQNVYPGHSATSCPFNRYCYDCYFEAKFLDGEYYGDSEKNTEYED